MSEKSSATNHVKFRLRSALGSLVPLLMAACVSARPGAVEPSLDASVSSDQTTEREIDARVPFERCADIAIVTREHYEAARKCAVIEGNLRVSFLSDVFDLEFPRLVEVQGDITPLYLEFPHPLKRLRLPALERVGGSVILSATGLEEIDWPELRSIGGHLDLISIARLRRFTAPELETIGGPMQITLNPKLQKIDLRELRRIEGDVAMLLNYALDSLRIDRIESVNGSADLTGLVRLRADAALPLWLASDQSRSLATIGCCIGDDDASTAGCEMFDVATCPRLR